MAVGLPCRPQRPGDDRSNRARGARERKRREAGKCEGRKSHAERSPELVALAKRLRRQKPKGGRPATQLAEIMAKVALELEAPQTKVRAVI